MQTPVVESDDLHEASDCVQTPWELKYDPNAHFKQIFPCHCAHKTSVTYWVDYAHLKLLSSAYPG